MSDPQTIQGADVGSSSTSNSKRAPTQRPRQSFSKRNLDNISAFDKDPIGYSMAKKGAYKDRPDDVRLYTAQRLYDHWITPVLLHKGRSAQEVLLGRDKFISDFTGIKPPSRPKEKQQYILEDDTGVGPIGEPTLGNKNIGSKMTSVGQGFGAGVAGASKNVVDFLTKATKQPPIQTGRTQLNYQPFEKALTPPRTLLSKVETTLWDRAKKNPETAKYSAMAGKAGVGLALWGAGEDIAAPLAAEMGGSAPIVSSAIKGAVRVGTGQAIASTANKNPKLREEFGKGAEFGSMFGGAGGVVKALGFPSEKFLATVKNWIGEKAKQAEAARVEPKIESPAPVETTPPPEAEAKPVPEIPLTYNDIAKRKFGKTTGLTTAQYAEVRDELFKMRTEALEADAADKAARKAKAAEIKAARAAKASGGAGVTASPMPVQSAEQAQAQANAEAERRRIFGAAKRDNPQAFAAASNITAATAPPVEIAPPVNEPVMTKVPEGEHGIEIEKVREQNRIRQERSRAKARGGFVAPEGTQATYEKDASGQVKTVVAKEDRKFKIQELTDQVVQIAANLGHDSADTKAKLEKLREEIGDDEYITFLDEQVEALRKAKK